VVKKTYFSLAVFGFAAGIGLMTIRVTVPPLHRAVEVLQHVASGDLTQRLEVNARDEVGHMATALNQALQSMRAVLQHIGASAQSVATSSED
jgi:methyl-accepting chemotaxis protein